MMTLFLHSQLKQPSLECRSWSNPSFGLTVNLKGIIEPSKKGNCDTCYNIDETEDILLSEISQSSKKKERKTK